MEHGVRPPPETLPEKRGGMMTRVAHRLRFRQSLIAGIILEVVFGAVLMLLAFLDDAGRKKLADWFGIGEYVRFPLTAAFTIFVFAYILGFIATSEILHLHIIPRLTTRVPKLRKPFMWFYRTQKRFFDYRGKTWVLVEMYGERSNRWRVAYVVNIIRVADAPRLRKILGPYQLAVVFVPSRSLSLDPYFLSPSERIIVLRDITDVQLWSLVLSSGSLVPEEWPDTCMPWTDWTGTFNPETIRGLIEHTEGASS